MHGVGELCIEGRAWLAVSGWGGSSISHHFGDQLGPRRVRLQSAALLISAIPVLFFIRDDYPPHVVQCRTRGGRLFQGCPAPFLEGPLVGIYSDDA